MPVERNFIAGRWVECADSKPNVNPSDLNDIVGHFAQADAADVAAAAAAARAALSAWTNGGPEAWFDILDRTGSAILARREELGHLLAREEGKILAEATAEVVRAGYPFKFFAGEALRNPGEMLASVRPGVEVEIRHEPVGVVGLITPWNFPIAIPV